MPADASLVTQLRRVLHPYLAPHRHSALLAAIIAAFAVRPLIGDTGAASLLFGVALVFLLPLALYIINVDEMVGEKGRVLAQSRRRRMIGWALATAAGAQRASILFVQSALLDLAGTICWLLFLAFVTLSGLRSVLKQREVTGEAISWRSSVYRFIVFTFALLFIVIIQLRPGSLAGLAVTPGHPTDLQHIFPVVAYFSLTTLSTIGYGDITPLTL